MQAEHERVQSRLFELQESKEAASDASAAADDFDKQQAEALTQQVRWVLGRHATWPKTHALPEQMDFSFF